jgi:hypothetical protein
MFAEPCIPDDIALTVCVLAAVNFDDEPMLATNKVSDVRPYWLLTNELEAIQATRAEPPPELSLRNRRILAKPSR